MLTGYLHLRIWQKATNIIAMILIYFLSFSSLSQKGGLTDLYRGVNIKSVKNVRIIWHYY